LHVGVKWLTTEYSGLILNILWQLYDRECCSTWSSHSHSLEWLLQQSTYLETLCSLSNQSRCNPLSVPLHIYLLFNSLLKFSTQKLFYVRMTNAYYKYLCMYINLQVYFSIHSSNIYFYTYLKQILHIFLIDEYIANNI